MMEYQHSGPPTAIAYDDRRGPRYKRIILILPVHNEEANLTRVVQEIDAAFAAASPPLPSPFVLFVDDGSRDDSILVIRDIVDQRGNAAYLSFSRNFGHQVAVMAGFSYAASDSIVVVMDADGQDPPPVAVELVQRVLQGADMAYGVRRRRRANVLKRFSYWLFYRLLSQLALIDIPLDAGDFCAYSPRSVRAIARMPEKHPYVRGLRAWAGFKSVGIPYNRPERYAGETSYSFWRLLKLASDGILGFSLAPLRFALFIGIGVFLLCVLLGFLYLIAYALNLHLVGVAVRDVPGFTTLIIVTLALHGLQMMLLGVIGEYLGRVFEESKRRPLFVVAESGGDFSHLTDQVKVNDYSESY